MKVEPRERLMCLLDGTYNREYRKRGMVDLGSSAGPASSSLDSRCRASRPNSSQGSDSSSLDQPFPQPLAQDPLVSAQGCVDSSDDMGYGRERHPVRGPCHNSRRDGHHAYDCPEPRQHRGGGGGKGGGKGGQQALDGAIAPYILPQLPGPEQPTNSVKGK